MERVSRVAPMATQITAGQADENARQSRESGLALNRLEDLRYNHVVVEPAKTALSTCAFYPIFLVSWGGRVVRSRVAKRESASRIGLIHVQKVIFMRPHLIRVNLLIFSN